MSGTLIKFNTSIFHIDPNVDRINFIKEIIHNVDYTEYWNELLKNLRDKKNNSDGKKCSQYNFKYEGQQIAPIIYSYKNGASYLCELLFESKPPKYMYAQVQYWYEYRYSGAIIRENEICEISFNKENICKEVKESDINYKFCNGVKRNADYKYVLCLEYDGNTYNEIEKIYFKSDGSRQSIIIEDNNKGKEMIENENIIVIGSIRPDDDNKEDVLETKKRKR